MKKKKPVVRLRARKKRKLEPSKNLNTRNKDKTLDKIIEPNAGIPFDEESSEEDLPILRKNKPIKENMKINFSNVLS